jgi:hypothetical protein
MTCSVPRKRARVAGCKVDGGTTDVVRTARRSALKTSLEDGQPDLVRRVEQDFGNCGGSLAGTPAFACSRSEHPCAQAGCTQRPCSPACEVRSQFTLHAGAVFEHA